VNVCSFDLFTSVVRITHAVVPGDSDREVLTAKRTPVNGLFNHLAIFDLERKEGSPFHITSYRIAYEDFKMPS
jgi:hypothetical protein